MGEKKGVPPSPPPQCHPTPPPPPFCVTPFWGELHTGDGGGGYHDGREDLLHVDGGGRRRSLGGFTSPHAPHQVGQHRWEFGTTAGGIRGRRSSTGFQSFRINDFLGGAVLARGERGEG